MQSNSTQEYHSVKTLRVVQINTCLYGSTGKIVRQIADTARDRGIEVWTATPYDKRNLVSRSKWDITIGNAWSLYSHLLFSRVTGITGVGSVRATIKFIKKLKKINPDIIHIHNLHNSYINIPILFRYIKKNDIKTVLTLHDCWTFTGRCPYFDILRCERWKNGCGQCPYPQQDYPISFVDQTRLMFRLKQKWFLNLGEVYIITPSRWLAQLVAESHLRNNSVKVIPNGIDLNVFKPTKGNFKDRFHISDEKNILLGVAFDWGKRKGLDVFISLAEKLDSEKFQIVLVGTDDTIDKVLPSNIISIHRTQSQNELAEIYTAADLFVNPTREDNYPTVNMESLACGTPVLTFNTGGSTESIDVQINGSVVECDNFDALEREIIRICENKPFSSEHCINHAKQFDMNLCFSNYTEFYMDL